MASLHHPQPVSALHPVHRISQFSRVQHSDQLGDSLISISGTLKMLDDGQTDLPQRGKNEPKALDLKFGCGFTWHLSIKVLRLRECCGVPWRAFFFAVMGYSGLARTGIAPI